MVKFDKKNTFYHCLIITCTIKSKCTHIHTVNLQNLVVLLWIYVHLTETILPKLGSLELLGPLNFISPLPNDALIPCLFLFAGLAGGVSVFSALKLGVTGLFTAWVYDSGTKKLKL